MRMTGVSGWEVRMGTVMRSSSSPTVGKSDTTSRFASTYSPHWTGTPTSRRFSRRTTLRPRRAAYRAAVLPAGPAPTTATSYIGSPLPGDHEVRQRKERVAVGARGEGVEGALRLGGVTPVVRTP